MGYQKILVVTILLSMVTACAEKGAVTKKRGGQSHTGMFDPATVCEACRAIDGYVEPDQIPSELYTMVGKARGDKREHVRIQKARGGVPTGNTPVFIGNGRCPEIDSEKWAIDYSHKRRWPAIHKGVDIPQPKGTPVLAAAAGTVIAKFRNTNNRKGIEVALRHTPEQTGLPFYTYTQYTHLLEMSPLPIGAQVNAGQEIAKIWNTGKMGRRIRRDALHFAVLYSASPEWTNDGQVFVPQDSYWMDPVAFYRAEGPYDSQSLAALPTSSKGIEVGYVRQDGQRVPADAARIWPFACK